MFHDSSCKLLFLIWCGGVCVLLFWHEYRCRINDSSYCCAGVRSLSMLRKRLRATPSTQIWTHVSRIVFDKLVAIRKFRDGNCAGIVR